MHDGNGNPTTYGGTSLTFDPENRLTSYGTVLTVGYTGDGLRAWKQTPAGRTYFLYDGTLPVMEVGAGGRPNTIWPVNTYGAAGLVSRVVGEAPQVGGAQSEFYAFDPQGSVVARVDAGGHTTATESYRAHGAAVNGGASVWGYGAQWGYQTDAESGLQLLTHRYYDPSNGRFLTRDPIGYRGGVNLYAYVRNNAIRWQDPLGQDIWGVALGGAATGGYGDMGPGAGGSGGTLYGYNWTDGRVGTASSYGYFYPGGKCTHKGLALGGGAGLGASGVWSNADNWDDLADGFDTHLFFLGPVSLEVDYGANDIMVVQLSPGTGFGGGFGYAHFNTYTPRDSIGTLQGLGSNLATEIDNIYGGGYCNCH